MTVYWFRNERGEKVEDTSRARIVAAAQKLSNRIKASVQIHSGASGVKSQRREPLALKVARNPEDLNFRPIKWDSRFPAKAEYVVKYTDNNGQRLSAFYASHDQAIPAYRRMQRNGNFGNVVGYKIMRSNPDAGEYTDHAVRMMKARTPAKARDDYKDAPQSHKKWVVTLKSGRDVWTIYRPTRAGAEKVKWDAEAAGATATIAQANPATKASKARRIASNKRGAYVEYLDGTKLARIKYGNKGIATIRAAAMKKDGWRKVRVVSA